MDEIISTLLGVIIGAIIGFVSSYMLWCLQEKARRKTILTAFEIELERLEPILLQASVIIQKIEDLGKPKCDAHGDDEHGETRSALYQELKLLKLYSESGNWYALKKDMFSLDPEISTELDKFYNNLTDAEYYRNKYLGEHFRDKQDIFWESFAKSLRKTKSCHLNIIDLIED